MAARGMAAPSGDGEEGQSPMVERRGGRGCRRTFKAAVRRQRKGGMLPAQSVLGVRTTWRHHLMERHNAVAGLELVDLLAHRMNNSADIVPLIDWWLISHPLWTFPVSHVVSLELLIWE